LIRRIAIFVVAVPASGTSIDGSVRPTANFGGGGTSSLGIDRSSSWICVSSVLAVVGAVSTTTSMSGVAWVNDTGTTTPAGRLITRLSIAVLLSRIRVTVTGPFVPLVERRLKLTPRRSSLKLIAAT
jgi:hypothetical protein